MPASGRNTYLTDTMIVVSLDPTTETVSMVSVPRDMVDVPLGDGRSFRGKINGLVSYARHHPKQFPGSDGTGFDVLMGALGALLDIPIKYYATVSLGGFVSVVNTLGGVNVNVAHAFCDPGLRRVRLRERLLDHGRPASPQRQPGARLRPRPEGGRARATSPGPRASRKSSPASASPSCTATSSTTRSGCSRRSARPSQTNVPRKMLPDLADYASQVGRDQTYRAVITHPLVGSGNDCARVDPDPGHPGHPQARRQAVPDRWVDAQREVRRAACTGSVKGSGVEELRPGATTAQADAQADAKPTAKPSAKPSATPEPAAAVREPVARALAVLRDARPSS